MISGIDISHWNGVINFNMVKNAGCKFIMIKAGGSDKGFYKDSKFEINYKNAKNVGISVGAYYFVGKNFTSAADGVADAERFYNLIKDKKFEFPVVLDIETTSADKKAGATDACIAFCEYLENLNYYVSIYASDISGFKEKLDINRLSYYDKWVARYGQSPSYVKSYGMWQYSSMGSIPGIVGNVDLDIAYLDYERIIKKNGFNGYGRK